MRAVTHHAAAMKNAREEKPKKRLKNLELEGRKASSISPQLLMTRKQGGGLFSNVSGNAIGSMNSVGLRIAINPSVLGGIDCALN